VETGTRKARVRKTSIANLGKMHGCMHGGGAGQTPLHADLVRAYIFRPRPRLYFSAGSIIYLNIISRTW
jgi:hypothetical protein